MNQRDEHDRDYVPFWVTLLWGLMNWLLSGYIYARVHGLNFWN